jgi:predicted ATPase
VIKTFVAQDYGCLKKVRADLTPLHAFIGPNDSGKSTLLHGLRTLVQLAGDHFEHKGAVWKPFDPFFMDPTPQAGNGAGPLGRALGCGVEGGTYDVWWDGVELLEAATIDGEDPRRVRRHWDAPSRFGGDVPVLKSIVPLLAQLRAARLVRFDPDALRRPSGLIPETAPVGFLDERGLGLAGTYFAIRNRDDETFSAIVRDVRLHFPTIKGIRIKVATPSEVVLEADLTSGAKVEAHRMSEGLLYYLAFAALRHLDPVSLLLVEEPENGLHPARIVEVMRILRAIAEEGTQVILATHSPLVINEMLPEEVSIVTRTEAEGTSVTLMKDTANFAKRSSVYALGELWLSFADGIAEAPLLHGRAAS